ncbi:RicAFT regulatory complex protein RicA family protein [Alkalihalobacillus sp. CinArs1]|uniref:RicAFT regulatory complex protein RicA family protein n=1 Tax=Alkalihalobacillus sp. CinArs1 TaxID=2995314 RepID=UPI0022DE06B7|nr:RicAFT regulatory complex protein RicA family protein [Alkalihalobacillus sp. CinArs1]
MISRQEVIVKAKELAKLVSETEEVDFFKRAEEKINENKKVQSLIARIKLEQKEAVNLQHYGKHEALKEKDERIDKLMEQLDEIPVVQEFKRSQSDVNDLLQLIANTISNTVTDEIIEATGGNVLEGTTGSAQGSGCSK